MWTETPDECCEHNKSDNEETNEKKCRHNIILYESIGYVEIFFVNIPARYVVKNIEMNGI